MDDGTANEAQDQAGQGQAGQADPPGAALLAVIGRADAEREARRYRDAAILYREAIHRAPDDLDLHGLCAEMFARAGDEANAEHYLREAVRISGEDAWRVLELARFLRTSGRLAEADAAYVRAAELRPGWIDPVREGDELRRAGWPGEDAPHDPDYRDEEAALRAAGAATLVPELAPRDPAALLHGHQEQVCLRRLGRRERSHWGDLPTVRGVEAIHGYWLSATPPLEMQVVLNGLTIHRAPLGPGLPVPRERDNDRLRKYVFNVWLDLSGVVRGRHAIELRLIGEHGELRRHEEQVVVAPPLAAGDSDGVVDLPPGDPRPIDAKINGRPSVVRPAARTVLRQPLRTVLLQRVDQLGDMVVSVPAIARLREILPDARLVGLVSHANAGLAATLGLFDEIVAIDFPQDELEHRRVMPLAAQEALRERLAPYCFDMAIDLSENAASRPLLLLSGAPFLYGFGSGEFAWLSAEVEGYSYDPRNRHEMVSHGAKLMGLVEWLGAMLRAPARVIRRDDLPRDRLAAYGLADGDYALLHAGARLAYTRWPHFAALARLILRRTDLRLVVMGHDGDDLPEGEDGRLLRLEGTLPFDDFDALISFARVVVGNDSGPKHLAALRGAPLVSVHMARSNWNEWGQDQSGYIVSRRVPCAGCLIQHEVEECGKGLACLVHIAPEEVFEAMARLL